MSGPLDRVRVSKADFRALSEAWDRAPELPVTEGELRMWWHEMAEHEVNRTVPKAIEYGSNDLVEIGRNLAHCMKRSVTGEEAAELGVFFYLQGKMARWTDAIRRGARPSDDTLFDIGVYVRMAQRIREAGGWPGTGVGSESRD